MVNYSTTTIQKEGTLRVENIIYNVSVTAVNNNLARLSCGITKVETKAQPDGNGGTTTFDETTSVGHITLEHGRQVAEVNQSEDLIPHLTKFKEILDEVLGKEPETTRKTTK